MFSLLLFLFLLKNKLIFGLCLVGGMDLRWWIWRDLCGLFVDERVVWIKWWMVRFEGIWGDSLWKFGIDLIDIIDLFLFFNWYISEITN